MPSDISSASPERTEPNSLLNHETSDHLLSLVEKTRPSLAATAMCAEYCRDTSLDLDKISIDPSWLSLGRKSAATVLCDTPDLGPGGDDERRLAGLIDHEPAAADRGPEPGRSLLVKQRLYRARRRSTLRLRSGLAAFFQLAKGGDPMSHGSAVSSVRFVRGTHR